MNIKMRIIVWGLGEIGTKWIKNFKLHQEDIDAEIIAVTDSNVDRAVLGEYEQSLFVEKTDISNLLYDYIVITSSRYFDEIRTELLSAFQADADKIISHEELYERLGLTGKKECNMCGAKPVFWGYLGQDNKLFIKKKVTGAGRRKGSCPVCGAMDRTRYVYHIMRQFTDIFEGKSVLHFAPEDSLKNKFLQAKGQYVSVDVVPGRADVAADITNLQFEDESFDYIICNHVLEHVVDEKKALSELHRCLKKGGNAIITVPICWDNKTYENPDIVTPEQRVRYYGQEDHVRLYGNDTDDRFSQCNFQVRCYKCNELLSEVDIRKYGFIENDAVFVLNK